MSEDVIYLNASTSHQISKHKRQGCKPAREELSSLLILFQKYYFWINIDCLDHQGRVPCTKHRAYIQWSSLSQLSEQFSNTVLAQRALRDCDPKSVGSTFSVEYCLRENRHKCLTQQQASIFDAKGSPVNEGKPNSSTILDEIYTINQSMRSIWRNQSNLEERSSIFINIKM